MSLIPILILSDCPSQSSGLARITRDLATVLAADPSLRVATLGLQGTGSSRLPFQTYHLHYGEFGELSLPAVWDEWSQGEPGVVFTIWDLPRVLWLARPEFVEDQVLRSWLQFARRSKFKLWSYVPVDATGPYNKLTAMAHDALLGIDRVLAFTPWARDVIARTIGNEEAAKRGLDWLPHGLNLRTFSPRPVYTPPTCTRDNTCKETADGSSSQPSGVQKDAHGTGIVRVGCVMTNQTRKDWGVAVAACAGLVERRKGNVRFWFHVDTRERHWSLDALVADFQLGEYVEISSPPAEDKWLAEQYRKCDLTILPSSEGFGYPLFESLACGVPCLHGAYAGGGSLLEAFGLGNLLVQPRTWRLEGAHNSLRPVFEPADWVEAMELVLTRPNEPAELASRIEHLSWDKLGKTWRKWFHDGL